jgi:iron complex outermembrane receptor protein
MLSKIDPGMIQDVIVIPGPYGLRYGPGLSFIDIVTQDTPRYQDGSGSDYRANGNIRTNGGQLYGRITADGGGDDYGYRISYGHRKGSDYAAGNGLLIPSSYDTGDVWAQFGYDINPHQHLEASYLRLDGADTEYADQFFDVDSLATNGGTLRLVDDDPCAPWTNFKLEGWWNRSNFTGSITPEKRRPSFPQITRVEFALDQAFPGTDNTVNGNTLGANVSSGARAVTLFGEADDRYLRMGADFRYLEQGLRENYLITTQQLTPPGPTTNNTFSTNLPFSRLRDEGLFAEYGFPLVDGWNVAIGGRADWADTNALLRDIRPDTNLDVDELVQHDDLYAYYLTNELKLNDVWTLNLGYGYAQRPPTLTERYADGVFLGILQSGFTRVIGNPALFPERDYQLDAGLNAKYDNFRGSLTGFYAWVNNYVTFDGLAVTDFFDAKLVRYRNTPLATLTGFEASGEWDWTCMFTPFATARYVQGTDESVGPLFGIPPLEGTLGFRWHDSAKQRMWEFEAGTRIVNQQNRLGEILILGVPTVIEERTGGFTTTYLRGYYNWSKDLKLVAGIDNVFNRSYQEHLDLRLLGPNGFPAPPTRVLSPGITPYFGIDWTF